MEDELCVDIKKLYQWLNLLNRMAGCPQACEVVSQLIPCCEKGILHDTLLNSMGCHLVYRYFTASCCKYTVLLPDHVPNFAVWAMSGIWAFGKGLQDNCRIRPDGSVERFPLIPDLAGQEEEGPI